MEDENMFNMLKSNMDEVKARLKKGLIAGTILTAIMMAIGASAGTLDKLFKMGIGAIILMFCMFTGIWYGREIVSNVWQAPIDENTGEPYYPGGISGSMVRWAMAIAFGITIGAIFFVIDVIRIIIDKFKKNN